MRVALVVPFYTAFGGAEKVDNVLGQMYPDADLFALFANEDIIPPSLRFRARHLSYLSSIPSIEKLYRLLVPLYASATEKLDLRGYDLVLSSDRVLAKCVLVDQHATHICYCHTPWRQIWDLYRDAEQSVPAMLRPMYSAAARNLRMFDFVAAQRVTHFVANSKYIANRIFAYYRRESTVIYPPVETDRGVLSQTPGDYYLSVSRLSHTKRLDVLIEACNRLGRRLLVVGEGREEQRLKLIAGPMITFLGHVDDTELDVLYSQCRAFLFAADEDFGIVPVEAQSFGRPVIAYGHGGSLETVRVDDPNGLPNTGVHFLRQTPESLMEAILTFEQMEGTFIPSIIRDHACQFDTSVFVKKLGLFIEGSR